MKNWTIGKRIILGGSVLLSLLLAVGIVSLLSLNAIKNLSIQRLDNDALPGIVYSAEMAAVSARVQIRALTASVSATEAARDEAIKQSELNVNKLKEAMSSYEAAISAEEDRANFEVLGKVFNAYNATRLKYIALVQEGKKDEAVTFISAELDPAYVAFRDQVTKMLKWNQDVAVHVSGLIVAKSSRATFVDLILVGAAIVLSLAIGTLIIRGINRALRAVSDTIHQGAEQVAAAASQVSSSSQSLAEGASEQAASLEETSSSLEEMASMAKRNAENVRQAKDLANETRQAADVGTQDMEQMKAAVDAIRASSDDVAKIVKTIDEIAFQTNILALNAAVEAARAGEAGAGFAVVADEVRTLAQRSAESARETASKIEEAISKSAHGVQISQKVAASLTVIAEKTRKVDAIVAEIATASHEQHQGVDQVNIAVGQMDKVTQSNAGNAEEGAAAAEELNAQSMTLKDAVSDLSALVGGAAVKGEVRQAVPAKSAPKLMPQRHLPKAKISVKPDTSAAALSFRDVD